MLLSVAAIGYWAGHGFTAAYPFGLNKNFLGALFAAVLTVVICAPAAVGLSPADRDRRSAG